MQLLTNLLSLVNVMTSLLVTDYKEEWDDLITKAQGGFYAYSYVWNKDDDNCSEFGTIAIQSFGGGIRRII